MNLQMLMGPIWAFGWALILYLFHREKTKRRLHVFDLIHKERILAIEKGLPYPELPPFVFDDESKSGAASAAHLRDPRMLLGLGIILILAGAGTLAALLLSGDEYHRRLWSFALIPIFVGVGAIVNFYLLRPGQIDRP